MAKKYQAARGLVITVWANLAGQDLIEYALMAGAVALSVAEFMPGTLMVTISSIYSKVYSVVNASAGS